MAGGKRARRPRYHLRYWEDLDFNLVTGKLVTKREYEDCEKNQEIYKRENERFVKKGIRITLEKRNQKTISIVTPKFERKIYIATKED